MAPDSPLHAILVLGLVLALILCAAYKLKRVQPARFAGSKLLKLVAQLGVGTRERIVVVEIGSQTLGLIVDGVSEVLRIATDRIEPPSPLVASTTTRPLAAPVDGSK